MLNVTARQRHKRNGPQRSQSLYVEAFINNDKMWHMIQKILTVELLALGIFEDTGLE